MENYYYEQIQTENNTLFIKILLNKHLEKNI